MGGGGNRRWLLLAEVHLIHPDLSPRQISSSLVKKLIFLLLFSGVISRTINLFFLFEKYLCLYLKSFQKYLHLYLNTFINGCYLGVFVF